MGEWTDEQCDMWWGDRRCLDELDHIHDDNGGHHSFDLRSLGVDVPVLVNDGARGLRRIQERNVA